jgi:hypothetical protein
MSLQCAALTAAGIAAQRLRSHLAAVGAECAAETQAAWQAGEHVRNMYRWAEWHMLTQQCFGAFSDAGDGKTVRAVQLLLYNMSTLGRCGTQ